MSNSMSFPDYPHFSPQGEVSEFLYDLKQGQDSGRCKSSMWATRKLYCDTFAYDGRWYSVYLLLSLSLQGDEGAGSQSLGVPLQQCSPRMHMHVGQV